RRSSVTHRIALAPSILSADFARLGEEVAEAEAAGADRIHVDVMDGHFVPNIMIGPVVVRSLRRVPRLPLEAHLMIAEPGRYLEAFADAGADRLTVHVEGAGHLHRTLESIAKLDRRVGLALNPATSAVVLDEVLPELDLVLVMTVDPGFGGQDFIPGAIPKIRRIRALLDRVRPECELEVDGGIRQRRNHEGNPATPRCGPEHLARPHHACTPRGRYPRALREGALGHRTHLQPHDLRPRDREQPGLRRCHSRPDGGREGGRGALLRAGARRSPPGRRPLPP